MTSGLLRWVPGTGSRLFCVLVAVLAAAKTGNNRPIWQVEKLRPERALMPKSDKRGPLLHPPASKLCAVSDPDKAPSGFSGAWSDLQQNATAFRRGQPSALRQGWAPQGAWEPSPVLSPHTLTPAPSPQPWNQGRASNTTLQLLPQPGLPGLAFPMVSEGEKGQEELRQRGIGLGEGSLPLESGQEQPVLRTKAPLNTRSPFIQRCYRPCAHPAPTTHKHTHSQT